MPRLLDLFCGAGLASDGYTAGGFEVVGVDIVDQPEYPYEFVRADALEVLPALAPEFDAIHASPPCQTHTRARHLRDAQRKRPRTTDLLTPTLGALRRLDTPWVVENVPGAPWMHQATLLCGSMFNLAVQRHRLFLSTVSLVAPSCCRHDRFPLDHLSGQPRPWGVYHTPADEIPAGRTTSPTEDQTHGGGRTALDASHAASALGVTRAVSWRGLVEGIPPAYTRCIAAQVLASL